jgi:hypothetical protein
VDGAPVAGSFASGLESGFAWTAAADVSFFSDAARGVAVALLSPAPPGPTRCSATDAVHLARMYFALMREGARRGRAAAAGGAGGG